MVFPFSHCTAELEATPPPTLVVDVPCVAPLPDGPGVVVPVAPEASPVISPGALSGRLSEGAETERVEPDDEAGVELGEFCPPHPAKPTAARIAARESAEPFLKMDMFSYLPDTSKYKDVCSVRFCEIVITLPIIE